MSAEKKSARELADKLVRAAKTIRSRLSREEGFVLGRAGLASDIEFARDLLAEIEGHA